MRWPLLMQNNTLAKPTQMFCEQTSFYRTREKLGPMCIPMQSSEPLDRICHLNGCTPQEQPFSCLPTIFISPLFMYNFNFQKFCPGPLTGLHCFTRSELPSLRAPHCLLWPCLCCFFLKHPHLRMCVLILTKQMHAWYTGWLGSRDFKASLQRLPHQGPNLWQTACHSFSLQSL